MGCYCIISWFYLFIYFGWFVVVVFFVVANFHKTLFYPLLLMSGENVIIVAAKLQQGGDFQLPTLECAKMIWKMLLLQPFYYSIWNPILPLTVLFCCFLPKTSRRRSAIRSPACCLCSWTWTSLHLRWQVSSLKLDRTNREAMTCQRSVTLGHTSVAAAPSRRLFLFPLYDSVWHVKSTSWNDVQTQSNKRWLWARPHH